jgi:hypothetical protein
VGRNTVRLHFVADETSLQPATESLSTGANGTGSGARQRTLPRAMWFLSWSRPGQDGTLCQVSVSSSPAICNYASATAHMDGRLRHSAWHSMERDARISGPIRSGCVATRSLCRRMEQTEGKVMKGGIPSALVDNSGVFGAK